MRPYWIYGLVLAGVLIVNLGIFRGSSSFASYGDLTKSRDVMRATVGGLKQENDGLKDEIQRLLRSPSYAKKVLRDKYHVTEPDEDIVFFAD
jgi:cell division protein FtsB